MLQERVRPSLYARQSTVYGRSPRHAALYGLRTPVAEPIVLSVAHKGVPRKEVGMLTKKNADPCGTGGRDLGRRRFGDSRLGVAGGSWGAAPAPRTRSWYPPLVL